MNSLSWFLYLAGTVDKASGLFIAVAVISVAASGLGLLVGGFVRSDAKYSFNRERQPEMIAKADRLQSLWKGFVPLALVTAIAAVFVPSKQTLYMIAASEIGERVATSEPVTEMAKEANDILRAYLKKAREELIPAEKK